MNKAVDLDMMAGFYPTGKVDISLKKLNTMMNHCRVTLGCLVSARGVFYDFEEGNTETLEWCRSSGERQPQFFPAGTVDLRKYEGNAGPIKTLREKGVRIWRLFPDLQGWDYSHPGFFALLKVLKGTDAVLYLPGKVSKIKAVTAGLDIQIIIDTHFYDLADTLNSLDVNDNIKLATKRLHGPGVLRKIAGRFGTDRLIFASGAPRFSLSGALAAVRQAGFNAGETADILGNNLLTIIGETRFDN